MLIGVVEENRKKDVMENLAGLEGIYYDTVKYMTVI